jgi:hypothetical protein
MKVIRGIVLDDNGNPLPSQNLTKEEAQTVLSTIGSAAFPFALGVPLALNELYQGIQNKNPVQGLLGGAGAVLGAVPAARASVPYINKAGEKYLRQYSTPYFNTETAVSNPALLQNISLGNEAGMAASAERLNAARSAAGGQFAQGQLPVGQGAWYSTSKQAPEFNPVYSQELPKSPLKVSKMQEPMRYAAQTSENLTQEGNAVMRFVPQVIQKPSTANALLVKNISPEDIQRLGARPNFLDNYVIAARPNNEAMIVPMSSRKKVSGLLSEVKKELPDAKIKTGYARQNIDRVYMDRSGQYGQPYTAFGAQPRQSLGLLDELDALIGKKQY